MEERTGQGRGTLERIDQTRSDLDLGLRMVDALVRRGDIGSAARLVDELRADVRSELVAPAPVAPAGRVRRSAVFVGTVAAALGIGLSAAALVTTVVEDQAPDRPATVHREAPPALEADQPRTTSQQPAVFRRGDSVTVERVVPATTAPVAGQPPGQDTKTPMAPETPDHPDLTDGLPVLPPPPSFDTPGEDPSFAG